MDAWLLLGSRALRMLGVGVMVVTLPLYLGRVGLSAVEVGAVLTCGMAGGAVATLAFGRAAGVLGRRTALKIAALAPALGAVLLLTQSAVGILAFAAFVGGVSASGQDVGPPQALEQAAIADLFGPGARRFAWYGLVGSLGLAFGSLLAGAVATASQSRGAAPYLPLITLYGATSLAAFCLYAFLGPAVESDGAGPPAARPQAPLGPSRRRVRELAALYSIDAMAGGVGAQSLVAYYFHVRFGLQLDVIGPMLFLANLAAAGSQLVAATLAERFGLLRTMVFTHLPSDVLLALVPLMPLWPLAAALLVARQSISQMDVPTRQAYTMAMVTPAERTATASATGAARTIGAAVGPILGGSLVTWVVPGLNLLAAGGVKAAYDLALYKRFKSVQLHPASVPRVELQEAGPGQPG
ncbi:MAG: MFS transporter [Candidatus Dormibacteria bacterium]